MAIDDKFKASKESQRGSFEKYFGSKPSETKKVVEKLRSQRKEKKPNVSEASIAKIKQEEAKIKEAERFKAIAAAGRKVSINSGIPDFSDMDVKDIIQQGLLTAFKVPNLNTIQNIAAPIMGKRFLNILANDSEATALYDDRGNIVGVRDKYNRLTGRDLEAQRQAMLERMNRERPEPANFLSMAEPVAPTQEPTTVPNLNMANMTLPYQTNASYYRPSSLDQPNGLLDFYQMYGLEQPEGGFSSQPMYSSPYAYGGYSLLS